MKSELQNSFSSAELEALVLRSDTPSLELARLLSGKISTAVIDVGARAAGVEFDWWRLDGLAKFYGFEPDAVECARLSREAKETNRPADYFPVGLGREAKMSPLYITQHPACSSIYEPDPVLIARYQGLQVTTPVRETQIQLARLDDWWSGEGNPEVSFVKIDTQGSELDILEGAPNLLAQCLGVEVEIEFARIYQNQPLFHQVDALMQSSGFHLWRVYGLTHYCETEPNDYTNVDRQFFGGSLSTSFDSGPGRLFWGNAIYLRDYRSDYFRLNPTRLPTLMALLEGMGETDGVCAASQLLVKFGLTPEFTDRALARLRARRLKVSSSPDADGSRDRLKSALTKADQWDRFRGSLLGRAIGRFY